MASNTQHREKFLFITKPFHKFGCADIKGHFTKTCTLQDTNSFHQILQDWIPNFSQRKNATDGLGQPRGGPELSIADHIPAIIGSSDCYNRKIRVQRGKCQELEMNGRICFAAGTEFRDQVYIVNGHIFSKPSIQNFWHRFRSSVGNSCHVSIIGKGGRTRTATALAWNCKVRCHGTGRILERSILRDVTEILQDVAGILCGATVASPSKG
mmetsp:Transcript_25774/g.53711  ORF Transcript_25774/g.53711 Transcript_25774/m.53711 type:complete len:211 (-) Transcript_25774:1993-2625(-)